MSTGWKINSSRIPELALPRKRAVPDSDRPLAGGGDMLKVRGKKEEEMGLCSLALFLSASCATITGD